MTKGKTVPDKSKTFVKNSFSGVAAFRPTTQKPPPQPQPKATTEKPKK